MPVIRGHRRETARRSVRQQCQDFPPRPSRLAWVTPWLPPILPPRCAAADTRKPAATPSDRTNSGPSDITIIPGPESYFDQEAGGHQIRQRADLADRVATGQHVSRTISAGTAARDQPLRGQPREAPDGEIHPTSPPCWYRPSLSAEDKHFFSHAGFDPIRVVKAAYVDIKKGRRAEGASTLSMQLAKNFFLEQDKRWTTQSRRSHHHAAIGTKAEQAGNLRGLRQPGLPGLARIVSHPWLR
ncbi:MAG: transglycosylase domain-containing protein [Ignavibacteriota bacterium]